MGQDFSQFRTTNTSFIPRVEGTTAIKYSLPDEDFAYGQPNR